LARRGLLDIAPSDQSAGFVRVIAPTHPFGMSQVLKNGVRVEWHGDLAPERNLASRLLIYTFEVALVGFVSVSSRSLSAGLSRISRGPIITPRCSTLTDGIAKYAANLRFKLVYVGGFNWGAWPSSSGIGGERIGYDIEPMSFIWGKARWSHYVQHATSEVYNHPLSAFTNRWQIGNLRRPRLIHLAVDCLKFFVAHVEF
jgi:hypothetical protein